MTALTLLFFEIIIVSLFNIMALWQRHIFLYLLVAGMDILFGLHWASQGTVGGHIWWEGIIIGILGAFFVFRVIMKLLKNE